MIWAFGSMYGRVVIPQQAQPGGVKVASALKSFAILNGAYANIYKQVKRICPHAKSLPPMQSGFQGKRGVLPVLFCGGLVDGNTRFRIGLRTGVNLLVVFFFSMNHNLLWKMP